MDTIALQRKFLCNFASGKNGFKRNDITIKHTMKKISILLIAICAMLYTNSASALDLSSLLNSNTAKSLLNSVISKSDLSVSDLAGSYTYSSPKVEFESENILKKAGGAVTTAAIESKIAPYFNKLGINNMTLTIQSDGSFTMALKKVKLSGKITKNSDGSFQFQFNAISKIKAFSAKAYIKKGTELSITFNATKLVTLISNIAKASNNSTATSMSSLLSSYKGLYVGFAFK